MPHVKTLHYPSRGRLDDMLKLRIGGGRAVSGNVPLHTHEFAELTVVVSGTAVHAAADGEYPLAAGDVYLTPPRCRHGYRDAVRLRRRLVMYDPQCYLRDSGLRKLGGFVAVFMLEPQFRRRHQFASRLRLGTRDLAIACETIARIEGESRLRQAGCEVAVQSLFNQLALHLSRCYTGRGGTGESAALLRVGEALSFMESHFDQGIRLKDLTARAHMSTSNFLRVFKAAMGLSPIEYLLRLRVLRGAQLLSAEGCNVTQAAMAAGFGDSNYFSRQFRRVMGISPRSFVKTRGLKAQKPVLHDSPSR